MTLWLNLDEILTDHKQLDNKKMSVFLAKFPENRFLFRQSRLFIDREFHPDRGCKVFVRSLNSVLGDNKSNSQGTHLPPMLNIPIKIILIYEDPGFREELKHVLNNSIYQLMVATSYEQGAETLKTKDIDVIIVSLSLPVEDGFSLCKRLRKVSSVPILVLSSIKRAGILEQALDAGADELLVRPISANILTAHLNTLARRAREEKKARKKLSGGIKPQDTRPITFHPENI